MMSKIKATAVVVSTWWHWLRTYNMITQPENFVRGRGGGSNFDNVVLVDDGGEDPNTTKAGHHWPASETPLNWRFAD